MVEIDTDRCPYYAPFFGAMGAASAMIFAGEISTSTLAMYHRNTKIHYSDTKFFLCVPIIQHSLWCCLWNGQVRHGDCSNGRDEARADHEVYYPRSHGRNHRHLRPSGRRTHWPGNERGRIFFVQVYTISYTT